jgi:hypothetical protein
MSAANGALRTKLEHAAAASSLSLGDLTVQSAANDPYRIDTPKGRRLAGWFAEQIERHVPAYADIHLRALHYRLIGGTLKPDGDRYVNNDESWAWLMKAAQCARWLHAVPFDRIADGRNDDPEILTVEDTPRPGYGRMHIMGGHVEVPQLDELRPTVWASRPTTQQPFRIVFTGEKSSLRDELHRVASRVQGELLLPTGECSDTMIERMAKRAAADGRPAVILYFHDYDPSGWTMPIHVARKVQALIDGGFHPGLNIRVFPVALTLQQCISYDLPSTPLKDSERRADTWRADTGREQTELDSLIALHPGMISQIAREAVRPFFDPTLASRAANLSLAWENKARERLLACEQYDPACALLERARADAAAAIKAAVEALDRAQAEAEAMLPRFWGEIPAPAPEVEAGAPDPLFDSTDDYTTASLKLIAHKRAAGVAA